MCNQWLSVAGLTFDVVGFLLIAFEWHLMFKREMHERLGRIVEDYAKSKAEAEGVRYRDPAAQDYTMWREFQKLIGKDKRLRQKLFYPGVVLVILGFILQVLGSWPGGLAGFRGC
jgi:uncharacterized membrane protein